MARGVATDRRGSRARDDFVMTIDSDEEQGDAPDQEEMEPEVPKKNKATIGEREKIRDDGRARRAATDAEALEMGNGFEFDVGDSEIVPNSWDFSVEGAKGAGRFSVDDIIERRRGGLSDSIKGVTNDEEDDGEDDDEENEDEEKADTDVMEQDDDEEDEEEGAARAADAYAESESDEEGFGSGARAKKREAVSDPESGDDEEEEDPLDGEKDAEEPEVAEDSSEDSSDEDEGRVHVRLITLRRKVTMCLKMCRFRHCVSTARFSVPSSHSDLKSLPPSKRVLFQLHLQARILLLVR